LYNIETYSFPLKQLVYESAPELRDLTGFIRHAAGRVQSEFDFDAAGGRARQVKERIAPNDSCEIETTLYLGAYERENHTTKTNELASAVLVKTVHRHSLGGGMIYTRTFGGSEPGTKLTNVLKDHLGSTDALVVGIWNGTTFANQSIERLSFDAWGERRDASTQISYRASDSDPFRTSAKDHDRGYTGHEQLDDSGLIHMNGRIYDPELGRFLSPDPVVQIPEYSQNFNRYSYVLNNPLNATDPSGFSFISKAFSKIGSFIKENWRTIVVIVVVAVAAWAASAYLSGLGGMFTTTGAVGGQLSATGMAVSGGFAGAIGGGLGPALNGGDIGDVLRGAVVGGIQGAIAGGVLHGMTPQNPGLNMATAKHVAGHGILGGAANEAMGGKFQDGFLSAAAGAAASHVPFAQGSTLSRTIKMSVVGGTVNEIGGGKFANGAWTAAFQHLLNAEAGNSKSSMGNNLKQVGKFALDLIGKAWNLPNTAIGLAWGTIGFAAEIVSAPFSGIWDFGVSVGHNSIRFTGHNLAVSAQALGNTTHYSTQYSPSTYSRAEGHTIGQHEMMHTYQGQQLGILYLPAVAVSYSLSLIMNGNTHGPYSFIERGPQTYGSTNKVWNFSSSYHNPYPGKWNRK
jgi:RHS repeat-associated protein